MHWDWTYALGLGLGLGWGWLLWPRFTSYGAKMDLLMGANAVTDLALLTPESAGHERYACRDSIG